MWRVKDWRGEEREHGERSNEKSKRAEMKLTYKLTYVLGPYVQICTFNSSIEA